MTRATRLLFLGDGSISGDVRRFLAPEIASGEIEVVGAVVRSTAGRESTVPLLTAREAEAHYFSGVDLVAECAGVGAAVSLGPQVIAAGLPLVLTSVGALAQRDAAKALLSGPGQLIVTNGAIGGFDALEATAMATGVTAVTIRTSKFAPTLAQEWMTDGERARLAEIGADDEPLLLFRGSPAEAIAKFPKNVNIAVALAWITRDRAAAGTRAATACVESAETNLAALDRAFERTVVEVVASGVDGPSCHRISVESPAGHYVFELASAPSEHNPRSSALTAMSLARDIRAWHCCRLRNAER